jgi:hypothetical protein
MSISFEEKVIKLFVTLGYESARISGPHKVTYDPAEDIKTGNYGRLLDILNTDCHIAMIENSPTKTTITFA